MENRIKKIKYKAGKVFITCFEANDEESNKTTEFESNHKPLGSFVDEWKTLAPIFVKQIYEFPKDFAEYLLDGNLTVSAINFYYKDKENDEGHIDAILTADIKLKNGKHICINTPKMNVSSFDDLIHEAEKYMKGEWEETPVEKDARSHVQISMVDVIRDTDTAVEIGKLTRDDIAA